jgi:hypothetical protein
MDATEEHMLQKGLAARVMRLALLVLLLTRFCI